MKIDFAEVRIPVQLDRERTMVFNLNTMAAFEQVFAAAGHSKCYFDTLLSLYDIYKDTGLKARADAEEAARLEAKTIDLTPDGSDAPKPTPGPPIDMLKVIRRVPMAELRALIWAATHEYDEFDVPTWPLTIEQVGRHLQPMMMPRLLNLVVLGHSKNSPSPAELGEAPSAGKLRAVPADPVMAPKAPTDPVNGGPPSIELPQDAFGSPNDN